MSSSPGAGFGLPFLRHVKLRPKGRQENAERIPAFVIPLLPAVLANYGFIYFRGQR
jgi:hypothetical protein